MKLVFTSIIAFIAFILVLMNNPIYYQEYLPWNSAYPMKKLLEPYALLFICFFATYQIIGSLWTVKDATVRKKNQTETCEGEIKSISYSSIRINNSPRFQVAVDYMGISKTFDPISEKIQTNFSKGDKVVIHYDKNDPNDSFLSITDSLKLSEETP